MRLKSYTVYNLAEFYQKVAEIAKDVGETLGQPLWFRGHSSDDYTLLPTILRAKEEEEINVFGNYNTERLREDYRIQNYKARVYHITQAKPNNRLEWQALYQHNFGKTRLLDWSESARTALSFALEPFLDPRRREDLTNLRHTIHPSVWILNPKKLNEQVYKHFSEKLVKDALKIVGLDNIALDFVKEFSDSNLYFEISKYGKKDIELDGILNLGLIDEYRNNHAGEIVGLLKQHEFNPFFYLCLRYYVDALPVKIENYMNVPLPPLAILHQYQSERIRAQRGVFTVFPNYICDSSVQNIKKMGFDCRALENLCGSEEYLFEIRLLNPNEIARNLIVSGERKTELYPENEYYVHTLEADKFFV
ncbi:MAG: FRG domain-containing protein [Lachnospiraceae bacterium]|nr:FRG domain-containing protein [Lachnospiraceae bacterium]